MYRRCIGTAPCCTYEGDEEGDDVDDCQSPARLQHGTALVDVDAEVRATPLSAIIPKRPQIDVDVPRREIGAICTCDAPQCDNSADKSSDETEIDQSDEEGIVPRAEVIDGGEECPR